jgi:EAL domain-containing protein (putative c-di-GMP-specific phosphodiesterase class I)
MNVAIEFINRLKREGFLFSLDDFGSGLSSFGYLKNLPVDFLKIDGMFVKNMDKDKFDYTIVKSIAEIGRVTGKMTVAEFVENRGIAEHLRALGIDFAQGYLFAEPRPLEELLSLEK